MAPVDYFLKIDGIEGESVDAMHKGEIDLQTWSWSEQNLSPGSHGGGGGGGKVQMQDFAFTMKLNKASPQLFLACAEGQEIKAAWVTARRDAGGKEDYFLKWSFSDLLVSSYATAGGGGEDPTEQVSFSFGKIEVEYKEQAADGSFGADVTVGWDVKSNVKI